MVLDIPIGSPFSFTRCPMYSTRASDTCNRHAEPAAPAGHRDHVQPPVAVSHAPQASRWQRSPAVLQLVPASHDPGDPRPFQTQLPPGLDQQAPPFELGVDVFVLGHSAFLVLALRFLAVLTDSRRRGRPLRCRPCPDRSPPSNLLFVSTAGLLAQRAAARLSQPLRHALSEPIQATAKLPYAPESVPVVPSGGHLAAVAAITISG